MPRINNANKLYRITTDNFEKKNIDLLIGKVYIALLVLLENSNLYNFEAKKELINGKEINKNIFRCKS
jgi:hypothetical protein